MTLSYRRYQAGDEAAIVALYRDVFQIPYDEARWRWQYQRNPLAARMEIALAFDGPMLVGHVAAVPLRLSGAAGSLRASHTQDVFVRRAYRRAGVFAELLSQLDALHRAHEVDLVLSQPNRRSFPAMTGSGGYVHLFDLRPFSLDLRQLRGPWDPCAAIEVSTDPVFSDADSAFLERELGGYGIHGARDRAWLDWRYHPDSGRRYRVVRARQAGVLVALAVVKAFPAGGSIDLVECVMPDADGLVRSVLRAIGDGYREVGLSAINLWSMPHFARHGRLLDVGFRSEDRPTHFIARAPVAQPDLRWHEPSRYYVSMGDSDVY